MRTKLGKIDAVFYGLDEYGRFGLDLVLTFDGGVSGVSWSEMCVVKKSTSQVTQPEFDLGIVEHVFYMKKLLKQAKVRHVRDLEGVPIEASFDENLMKEFRILTEVL